MVPPAENPNYVTQINLGLVPTLQAGQDELGFATVHQIIPAVHPTKKLYGWQWWEKQQVEGPCPYSTP